jgi:acetyl esterase/lipase
VDFKAARIVLAEPRADRVQVRRDLVYKQAGDLSLKADLYLPAGMQTGARVPAVLLVHGDAPWEILHDAKEWGQYQSWGELIASSGLAAIAFTHRSTERLKYLPDAVSDVVEMAAYLREHAADLGIDADRLGVWVCSAGGPVGLTPVLKGQVGPVRCAAALYALLDIGPGRMPEGLPPETVRQFSPVAALAESQGPLPPLLLVRAGQDHPDFTQSAERFIAAALARNADVDVINYPTGYHAFDVRNDDERSRQIIRRVLTFFHEWLSPQV